jgi:hypothetical protein
MKTDVNVPSKSNTQKKLKNLFFVGILSATDEKSRIRTRNRSRKPVVRIRGSRSVPKCHGSTTLDFSFAKFRSHLVDDLLLGNEVPEAQQVDIPSLGADEQALAPRLQAEGRDGLEPALQAGWQ